MKNHLILQSKMWIKICKIVDTRACSSGFNVVPVQLPAVTGWNVSICVGAPPPYGTQTNRWICMVWHLDGRPADGISWYCLLLSLLNLHFEFSFRQSDESCQLWEVNLSRRPNIRFRSVTVWNANSSVEFMYLNLMLCVQTTSLNLALLTLYFLANTVSIFRCL